MSGTISRATIPTPGGSRNPLQWTSDTHDAAPEWKDDYWQLRAVILAGDKPTKRMISRHSQTTIDTGYSVHSIGAIGWIFTPPELLARSVWLVGGPMMILAKPEWTALQIPLYNGGFEATYIEHGQLVALAWALRS